MTRSSVLVGAAGRTRFAAVVAVSALATVLVACSDGPDLASPTAAAPSGVRGTVTIDTRCSTPAPTEEACTTPYVATIVVMDADEKIVGRITSGPDGRFEVALPPGEYALVPQPAGDPFPQAQPVSVNVAPGEFASTEIDYDSGARGDEPRPSP